LYAWFAIRQETADVKRQTGNVNQQSSIGNKALYLLSVFVLLVACSLQLYWLSPVSFHLYLLAACSVQLTAFIRFWLLALSFELYLLTAYSL
jgi:hypothetical protein